MKIKAVCELTGLSDRTIRYYIEQELVAPSYTENYLGRKAYRFSQKDIDELNNIATLRNLISLLMIFDISSLLPKTAKSLLKM